MLDLDGFYANKQIAAHHAAVGIISHIAMEGNQSEFLTLLFAEVAITEQTKA